MELRNRSTGAIITQSQFRNEFSSTSFPKILSTEVINDFGYDVVLNGPAATVTLPYQYSQRDGVEQISGQWFTKFVAGPIFTDTTDKDGKVTTAANSEAAYRAKVDSDVAKIVRTQRDNKLAACDWTVLTDSPLTTAKKTEWKTYRQALRDITSGDNFPHSITWPSQP